ncbi:UDP-glucosyltransferase 2-like [Bradysia coprophila]|uniref:UDP-glucosyltransferase 2-like n=1 Tax=Bradysia coprophila TaxID=38358 RepID=UPI00187D7A76|nr:UDP-glucosyltransferase 2-like [Bradysia coprophila]
MKIVHFGVVFVVLLLADNSENARILGVFPTPSISHQVVFHALMKDLAARGHHLTVLTTDALKIDNPNVTEINLHDSYDVFHKEINFVEFKEGRNDEEKLMRAFMPVLLKVVENQLEHPAVKNIIENRDNQTFDVVIIEHLFYLSTVAFAEIYDCPIIGITSLDTVSFAHEAIGNEANPVIHPEVFFSYKHGQLSFVERWKSLKFYLRQLFLFSTEYERDYMIQIRKHFPTVTASLDSMNERIQLVMTNTHPAMGFIRPILPNTIQLGFMHIEPPAPLPDSDLKTFLDSARNGVIYMSLGSNVKSKDLSPEILAIFLTVFGNLTYNVVWKFEADNLPNKPDNVFISKWLPQSDLLAHPSIKLFITQGGQQSMEESIDRTVPMIVIPFLGDQDSNAKRMVQKGIGHHLELHALTEGKLRGAITEMLKPIYKHNVQKLKELVNDQPMTSREKAVWWTEYVIRHKGAKHLEYPGRSVPFYQRYCLDFISIGFGFAGLLFAFINAVLRKCFSFKKSKIE